MKLNSNSIYHQTNVFSLESDQQSQSESYYEKEKEKSNRSNSNSKNIRVERRISLALDNSEIIETRKQKKFDDNGRKKSCAEEHYDMCKGYYECLKSTTLDDTFNS